MNEERNNNNENGGNYVESSSEYRPGAFRKMIKVPYFIIVPALYVFLGLTIHIWSPTWILFLTIPAYYQLAWSFKAPDERKFKLRFPVIILSVTVYIALGMAFPPFWKIFWLLFVFDFIYYWKILFR